jgi:hypothetical protein
MNPEKTERGSLAGTPGGCMMLSPEKKGLTGWLHCGKKKSLARVSTAFK